MNISRHEQRVLHELARGGQIRHVRNDTGKITKVLCVTHDGSILSDCTLSLFQRLRRRGPFSTPPSIAGRPGRSSIQSRIAGPVVAPITPL